MVDTDYHLRKGGNLVAIAPPINWNIQIYPILRYRESKVHNSADGTE